MKLINFIYILAGLLFAAMLIGFNMFEVTFDRNGSVITDNQKGLIKLKFSVESGSGGTGYNILANKKSIGIGAEGVGTKITGFSMFGKVLKVSKNTVLI